MVNSLTAPIVWVLAFLIPGVFFSRRKRGTIRSGAGWYLVLAGTLALLALSAKPVANLLIYSLERRYTRPASEALRNLDGREHGSPRGQDPGRDRITQYNAECRLLSEIVAGRDGQTDRIGDIGRTHAAIRDGVQRTLS
jgi:hypothetical protein